MEQGIGPMHLVTAEELKAEQRADEKKARGKVAKRKRKDAEGERAFLDKMTRDIIDRKGSSY